MREVLGRFAFTSVVEPPRKKPLYYYNGRLAILGHYESPCGGCDTIGSARAVYELIQSVKEKHPKIPILCEGLLLSEDTKWSSQLVDLRVIYLTTPLDECLKRIKSRRESVGNDKPLNPANTENRVAVIERSRLKLIDNGVICRRATSKQAPTIILDWINGRTC